MKTNILIVEDQAMPRELFEIYIKSNPNYNLIGSIDDANQALMYCEKLSTDLVIMDVVTKNGASGLDAAAKIKTINPRVKIIIATSMPEVSYIKKAKEIGIEGFWYKEASKDSILDVVEKIINGEIIYPDSTPVVQIGICKSTDFTNRELDILRLLVTGNTDKEIADKLYLSETTVHSKIRDILCKTGFKSRTRLAVALIGTGFIVENFSEEENSED